jgi:nucleoporin NUP42
LIVGTDRSPEEDRLAYYLSMRTQGNTTQYVNILTLINKTKQAKKKKNKNKKN